MIKRAFALLGLLALTAATSPPVFMVPNVTVAESAGVAPFTIYKSSKASSYSKVNVQTIDGTCHAGINYQAVNITLTFANSELKRTLYATLIDNNTYNGDCTFRIKLTAVRFATVPTTTATVTVADNELPPPPVIWTKCAEQGQTCYINGTANVRYGANGTYYTKAVTGAIVCDVGPFGGDPLYGTLKTCETDGTVGTAPPPPPPPGPLPPLPAPPTGWVAARLLPFNYGVVVSTTNCPLLVGVMSSCPAHYPIGAGRTPEVGEVVALYANGWGWSASGTPGAAPGGPYWTVYSLKYHDTLTVFSADMEGVAPAPGVAEPVMPADWFAGISKTATKNCGALYGPGMGPGVSAGVAYRITLLNLGGTVFPAMVSPDAAVSAVPAADYHFAPWAVVAASCFTP